MTSITVNLTLEQVLEFFQNLPLEYKQAVKQKLENEKVEEINQNETTTSTISDENKEETIEQSKKSIVDEIAGIIKDDNLLDYKTLRNEAIVARYKEKSEAADREQEDREQEKKKEADDKEPKKSLVNQIRGIAKDPHAPDYKTLRNQAIAQRYKERS